MKKNNFIYCVAWLITIPFAVLHAQEREKNFTREMTLEREYDPSLQDASRINRLPRMREPEVIRKEIEYADFTAPTLPERTFEKLDAGQLRSNVGSDISKGYLNFGIGMFLNMNIDAGYRILETPTDQLQISYSNRFTNGNVIIPREVALGDNTPAEPQETTSADGTFPMPTPVDTRIVDFKQRARLNDNLGRIDYRHYFPAATLNANLRYNSTAFNYYGLPLEINGWIPDWDELQDPDVPSPDRNSNQLNQNFVATANIRSGSRGVFAYMADIEWLNFSQRYSHTKDIKGLTETRFTARGGLNRLIGDNEQRVGIDAKFVYLSHGITATPTTLPGYVDHPKIMLTPYYRIGSGDWKVRLGGSLMLIADRPVQMLFAPDVAGEVRLGEHTTAYTDISGRIESNDAAALAQINRYVDLYTKAAAASQTPLDGVLGVRSGIFDDAWIEAFAGYRITKFEVFFVPAYWNGVDDFGSYSDLFQPNVGTFKAGATLKYSYRNYIDVSLKGTGYKRTFLKSSVPERTHNIPVDEMKAYNKPSFELEFGITSQPVEPLTLSLNYYLGSGRYTLLRGESVKMDPLSDLNLMAAWRLNQTFAPYLKLNNLLANEQQLFYGYYLQRFNAMAGVQVNF